MYLQYACRLCVFNSASLSMALFRKNKEAEIGAPPVAPEDAPAPKSPEVVQQTPETAAPETEYMEPGQSQDEHFLEDVPQSTQPADDGQQQGVASVEKSETLQGIEHIMEEDMGDIFHQLDAAHQQEFKKRGEETATLIERMVVSAQVSVQKVFQLIISWLRIIPKVNKHYLEQEAKIKADRIIHEIAHKKEE